MKNTTKSSLKQIFGGILSGIVAGLLAGLITLITTSILHLPDKLALQIGIPLVIVITALVSWLVNKYSLLLSKVAVFLLFSFGILIMLSAYRLEMWSDILWDIRVVGLGTSLIAVAIGFWALYTSSTSKEMARNLDKTAARLDKSINTLENRVDAALQKYERLAERLIKLQAKDNSKDNQTEQ